MSAKRISLVAAFIGLLVSVVKPHAAWCSEDAAGLRYRFLKGTTLIYEVRIEAEREEHNEVFTGYSRYEVTNESNDEVSLTFKGALEPSFVPTSDPQSVIREFRSPLEARSLSGIASPGVPRTSQITIDQLGRGISSQGSSQLPYLLGNLSEMIFETLPGDSRQEWSKVRDVEVVSANSIPRILLREDTARRTAMTEDISYRCTGTEGDLVRITKSYNLSTSEKIKDKPRIEVDGESKLTFDQRQGLFVAMNGKRTLTIREPKVTREIPLTITYQLLDDEAVARVNHEASRSLTTEELEDVLDDLQSKHKALGRILKLQQKAPENPNPEVGSALAVHLESPEQSTRFAAARALENWATVSDLPALTRALEDPFNLVRYSALNTVARLKPEDALQPALKMMTGEATDRRFAVTAIQKVGTPAEDALIELLNNDDWMIRLEAVKLLKDLGTEKSLTQLKSLKLNDDQALIRSLSENAINLIRDRSRNVPD